jgi:RecB family exonuclease
VAAIAAALPPGPGATRLADLGRVYAAYAAALGRLGAVDRRGRDRRVCEALLAAEADGRRPATLAGVTRIVFAEIYDFSVLQFLIATSLVRLVGDAELVAFAHPENVDATRFLDRTWNRFVGDPAIADQVLPSFVERRGRSGNLAAVLRGVFTSERPPPAPPDGTVRIVVAPSRYREVEAAVRDVRERLERGEAPERIAILARDLAVYGDLIEDVCRRYRVPVYFRKGRPLLGNGLVKACLNALRCVVEEFPRSRLEAVLESDYFAVGPRSLVRTLRAVGFVSETARPLGECIVHSLAGEPRRREQIEADGVSLLRIMAALRELEGERTVRGHATALRRALGALRVRPVPGADPPPAAARRDARAWERLRETLALLAGLGGELGLGPIPLAEFVTLLVAALEPLEIQDPAQRAGSVRALSVLDARGLDFDVVHLLGLDDGTFPAGRAESPLWPDAMKREAAAPAAEWLRRKLGRRAEGLPLGGLLRTAREASLEDPFLFFLALSMAERAIVLWRPAVDERGNATVPSPFLDEVRACVAVPETVLDPGLLVPPADACCELAELVERAAIERWTSRPGDAAADRLTAALAEGPDLAVRIASIDRRAAIEERRTRYLLTPRGEARKEALADRFVGRLGDDGGARRARIAAMHWSPNRLQALGACGFKFFARYLLGLYDEDDPEAAVGDAERGTLAHAVLEVLFRDHPRLPADLEAARERAREVLAGERARIVGRIRPKDPALLDVAWQQVAAAVDALVVREHEEQLRQTDIEVEYVLEQMLACVLPARADGDPIVLEGRADRIEVHRRAGLVTQLRVLDYKMSRAREKYAPLLDPARELGRTGFQIPVYLLTALARVGNPDDVALSGGYLFLRAEGPPLEHRFSRAQLEGIADGIRGLVARASDGYFDVDPEPCDPYCPHRPVCRYQRPPLEEESAGE